MLKGVIGVIFLAGVILSSSCHKALPLPEPEPQYDPRNISRTETFSSSPSLDIRGDRVAVVWSDSLNDGNWEVLYREKIENHWSSIENISNTSGPSLAPQVVIDIYGNTHVVWNEGWHVYYRMKGINGHWSEIQDFGVGVTPEIGTDSYGNVYVIWAYLGLWYTQKTGGSWTEKQGFAHGWADNPSLCVTSGGHIYVVAEGGDSYTRDIYLYEKMSNNEWLPYFNITNNNSYCWFPSVYGRNNGEVYVSWTEYGIKKIGFRVRKSSGIWENIDTLPGIVGAPWCSFIWGKGDTIVIVWEEKQSNWDIYYRMKIGNEWGEKVNISNTIGDSFLGLYPKIRDGKLYIAWSDSTDGNFDIFYDEVPLHF